MGPGADVGRGSLPGFGGFLAAQAGGGGDRSFWMPFQGSTTAAEVDWVFHVIYWISLFFFVLIVGAMVLFIYKYRRRAGRDAEPTPSHNTPLEVTWTVIPLLLVIWIFYIGFKGYMNLRTPPANAYEIQVTGQTWKWLFTYPNGHVDEKLHVPVDRPVLLTMTSQDMIHSFYVPDFRIKMDVLPGRYTKTWFQARYPGEYRVFCTEYCGTGHSDMLTTAVVHEPGGFERWLDEAASLFATLPPVEVGARLYEMRGCTQCHSVDGTPRVGPTLKGVFGGTIVLKDRGSVTADENYIRESILDPQAKIVAGFDPVMPTYQGRLKDQEITGIIEYIKSLGE
jgi:cytochrome c oxidase subunit 2